MTESQARNYFFGFAFLHLILWTLIPAWVSPHAPLDVIEGYAWGREFLIGTHKHPPMQSWLLEIFATLTQRSNFAHFLASQIAIVIAFWAVWDIGKKIATPAIALASVLLLEAIVYYNFVSTEFNPNILQIMFWALIAHAYYFAIKTNRISCWILLGVWAAAGIYSKYYTLFFLLSLVALTLYNQEARKKIMSYGPYLALAICALLIAPHLLWLAEHDFLPLSYAKSRALNDEIGALRFILEPAKFAVSQFALLLPMLILGVLLCGYKRAPSTADKSPINKFDTVKFDKDFLIFAAFGTLIISIALSAFTGLALRNMWGASFWNFLPLWLIVVFFGASNVTFKKRFLVPWAILSLSLPIIFGIGTYAQPYLKGKVKRVHFPGQELSMIISDTWEQRYHTPLAYVIGDTWVAGSISFYAPSRPSLFLENNPIISHWTNTQDVLDKGAVLVTLPCLRGCNAETMTSHERSFSKMLNTAYPQAEIQAPLHLRPATQSDKPKDMTILWALIPPAQEKSHE